MLPKTKHFRTLDRFQQASLQIGCDYLTLAILVAYHDMYKEPFLYCIRTPITFQ